MTDIVPAIDIMDGRCVRLTKGDYSSKKEYSQSPLDQALAFADTGVSRLHLVDLDGAKASSPRNLKTLEAIAGRVEGVKLEWGGGLKTGGDLISCFNAGCTDAVIGSTAAAHPELFGQWLADYGPDHIVLGADIRNGLIAIKGWLEDSNLHIEDLVTRFEACGLKQCIVTEISRDGMLQGPADELYCELKSKWPEMIWTASGGVCSMADIETLAAHNIDRVIVGKAYYEGRISLKDIEIWSQNA